ncbi:MULTISPECIES: hypothetical protein [Paenibacillus]|uniref:HBM domain-containing protein n=1 Tax=Paenibacillus odorifer TaxID=189426 RepID=A0A1R0X1N5_9BACL|nr:hypothetical protein [Paenibacillus odorifer]OMD26712.1 hypothetical protein BJP51_26330 [Paenibacillus odorifer]OME30553.1 hypothetical protein BSK63_16800 [Paenibacillus odorifer]
MNKTFRLKVLAFCILISIFSAGLNVNAATESNFVTSDQLQNSLEKLKMDMVTKEDLQTMVQQPGDTLTKEEITQQLIDTQKTRIAILEGNINALLSLIAVIVAGLTLFGGMFVWISKRTFSSKVEEVETKLIEMKQLNNEALTKVETVRELNSNLNMAIREAQDLHVELYNSKRAFDEATEEIDLLRNYVVFLELKASRSEIFRKFENKVNQYNSLIYELENWLVGTLPNYGDALKKVTKIFGENVIKDGSDETILEKLSYYKESLKENEDDFWKQAAVTLEWIDYEEKDNFIDPLNDSFLDWESTYEDIEKVHSIIATQIKMNPDKFIPKI